MEEGASRHTVLPIRPLLALRLVGAIKAMGTVSSLQARYDTVISSTLTACWCASNSVFLVTLLGPALLRTTIHLPQDM